MADSKSTRSISTTSSRRRPRKAGRDPMCPDTYGGVARAALIAEAKRAIDAADRRIKEFAAKLESDPAEAFAWSQQVIDHACRRRVAAILIRLLSNESRSVDDVLRSAHDEALRMAEFPERSTSVISNFVHQMTAAAWAGFARSRRL